MYRNEFWQITFSALSPYSDLGQQNSLWHTDGPIYLHSVLAQILSYHTAQHPVHKPQTRYSTDHTTERIWKECQQLLNAADADCGWKAKKG